ncbi:MAG: PilZ domain-containing protein [Candidatus Dormibacteria bacterium]
MKIDVAQAPAIGDRIRACFRWQIVMEQKQRRDPRYQFIASAELLEENSGSRMSTRISDLSLGGCYVDTINPLPDGTLVHLKIYTETHSFETPATVAYSHANLGIGMKFREVPAKSEEVLRLWLPDNTQQSNEGHI